MACDTCSCSQLWLMRNVRLMRVDGGDIKNDTIIIGIESPRPMLERAQDDCV